MTDHAEILRLPRFGKNRWDECVQSARSATAPGRFVALPGFEYTHPTDGHVNVLGADRPIDAVTSPHWASFLASLISQPSAIGMFNHPGHEGTRDWNDFAPPPAQIAGPSTRQMALIRADDEHGRFGVAYRRALDRGWRLAPQVSHDDHQPTWGRGGPGRTGVVAAALTEDALLDALRQRRTFATTDPGLSVTMRAGGVWMGSPVPPGQRRIRIVAWDSVPDDDLLRVELVGPQGKVLAQHLPEAGFRVDRELDLELIPGEAVFARAVQRDGGQAISAPLFGGGN